MISLVNLRKGSNVTKRIHQLIRTATHEYSIKKIGVVGLGLMGHGIAQVSAQAQFNVVAIESNAQALEVGRKRIDDSMRKVVAREAKKSNLDEATCAAKHKDVMDRISFSTDLTSAKDCDMIVEAIAEDMQLKLKFYDNLGKIIKSDAIFASNTSSLPITGMAEISKRQKQFVGLHFFNPVQMMQLVEVIETKHTDPSVFDSVFEFVKQIGKTPVRCGDTPGFIVNRILVPTMATAMGMIDRKVASVADIDVSMKLGAGHPMGPLHLADYVGLDTCLSILKGWVDAYPEEKTFFIPKVLETLVAKGHLGRKSGKGFYNWDGDKIGTPNM